VDEYLFVGGPWDGQTKTLPYQDVLEVAWPQDPVIPNDWSKYPLGDTPEIRCRYSALRWFGITFYAPADWSDRLVLHTFMERYRT